MYDFPGATRVTIDKSPQLYRIRTCIFSNDITIAMPFSTATFCVRVGCIESQVKRSATLNRKGLVEHYTDRQAPFRAERATAKLIRSFKLIRRAIKHLGPEKVSAPIIIRVLVLGLIWL